MSLLKLQTRIHKNFKLILKFFCPKETKNNICLNIYYKILTNHTAYFT